MQHVYCTLRTAACTQHLRGSRGQTLSVYGKRAFFETTCSRQPACHTSLTPSDASYVLDVCPCRCCKPSYKPADYTGSMHAIWHTRFDYFVGHHSKELSCEQKVKNHIKHTMHMVQARMHDCLRLCSCLGCSTCLTAESSCKPEQ